ncbi:Peptidoglycan-binding (PGRP) domain of peptidoglycan hydrolases-containing protein [Streptomyces mirabilis]|uniref:Peptidoglycan-binding (PGRP) domain of peptidoglycan hydrolases-containing protein n=1 Tax=Streptomyces mirabilis TaxID=68239 RepID=A0A1I2IFV0_9ACTN|nr:Peptidoglycan-binding (PGRP) domain of peptidoglycan hydrolases-containing protein [Streptomyces mirabilis]
MLLALLVVMPAQSAVAEAGPPAPGPGSELVPGVPPGPHQPWQVDTPDQMLPPRVYTPSAQEDAVEPRDAPAETDALIEYVPLSEAVAGKSVTCSKLTGPYQRQVERWLKLKVDGKQSARDCAAIRAFQTKEGIKPNTGFAGPVTWARMQLMSAKKKPNAAGKCPVRSYRVACVDLTRQLTWVQKGKKVLWGPVPMRSGRAGYRTRTGWFKVYWKHKSHWSTLYNTPMPYSQFFSGGEAFHAIYGSIYDPNGSYGCVNLRLADARSLWNVTKTGDHVYVWGRRAGT